MRRAAAVLVALILLASPGARAASISDNLGGVFNDIGEGSRPLGMGDAFAAVADDANAVDENPAGLAFLDGDKHYATFTHSELYSLSFLNRDYVSYAQGDQGYSAFGFSWNQLSANLDPGSWDEDSFQYSGAKQVWGFSKHDWVKASVGWQLKYLKVSTDLGNASVNDGLDNATGTGVDETLGTSVSGGDASGGGCGLGALVELGKQWSAGLVLQDLYSAVNWGTGTREVLPETTRLGVAYRPDANSLVSVEVRGQTQGSSSSGTVSAPAVPGQGESDGYGLSSYHAGGEYWLLDGKTERWGIVRNIGFRVGYYDIQQNDDGGVLTAGASVKSTDWSLDYTYEYGTDTSGLGDTQRFGLDLQF